jgi:hypothetical protein
MSVVPWTPAATVAIGVPSGKVSVTLLQPGSSGTLTGKTVGAARDAVGSDAGAPVTVACVRATEVEPSEKVTVTVMV